MRPNPRIVCLWSLVFPLAAATIAFGEPIDSGNPSSKIPINFGTIAQTYGPNRDDTPGALSKSGSYSQGTRCGRDGFALKDVHDAEAFVEVVMFPRGYSYAGHDAFGLLLMTAAYDPTDAGATDLSAAAVKIRCVPWEFADKTKGGTICYTINVVGKVAGGYVAWNAGTPETGVVSVGIGFRNLAALPGQVVDRYLREFPSTLPAEPTWHLNWDTKDLEKWADVLDKNKGDLELLQAGGSYLMRYDKRSFGLLDVLQQRDNAASSPQALDDVISRLSQAAAERKVKSAQPDNPND